MNINLPKLRPATAAATAPVRTPPGAVASTTFSAHTDAPRITRPFLTIMAIVGVLSAIYYGLIAAPMYVSEARFTIRGQQAAMPANLLAGLTGKSGSALADIAAVQAYIESPDMLEALEKQYHLRQAYSRFRLDLFHWLPPNASDDAFRRFYKHMVVVKLQRDAEIVSVDVRSFDRDLAQPMAETILQRTEAFVDGMSQRMRTETMRSAEQELALAEKEAGQARAAVTRFRGATSSIDPRGVGAATQGGEAALESQAAVAQAELASLLTVNKPDSPVVRQLQAKLSAIRAQAARLKAQQGVSSDLSKDVTAYETLAIVREAAEKKLAAATMARDSARSTAEQREKYVVRVVNPNRPDRPVLPRRVMDLLMVMVFALAGYSIIALTIAGIRDHRGV